MENISNKTLFELEEAILSLGGKKYNAKSIFDFIYKKNNFDIISFSNIKKEIRENLLDNYEIIGISLEKVEEDNNAYKFLFKLKDLNYIEAVLMKHNYGNSLCLSSQVGCNMGCLFCESGKMKKTRDLEVYEMINQILLVNKFLEKDNEKITHVVVMGIGEPMDNYDNVMKMIRIINDPFGLEIGARHITVSTCGIIPEIEKFMSEGLQVNLAISLHFSNNKLRDKYMPINKVYNIESLMSVVKKYIEKTNRRVTIEYILLDNINDSISDALELVKLLKGLNIYVNLIPYNETRDERFRTSKKEKILAFYDILKKNKINVTVRREFGKNITGACGQLRSTYEE